MKFTHKTCPLHSPIKVGNNLLKNREWIEVQADQRIVELAPLPGLHSESLKESLEDFKSAKYNTPSALFAKEALELEQFNIQSCFINKLDYIDIDSNPLEYYKKWNDSEVVKLKIGRSSLDLEIEWLVKLLENNHKNVIFRLDANRSLTLKNLNMILERIPLKDIQYFEEPLINVQDYNNINNQNISIALDESIHLRDTIKLAKYLVIKPTFNLSLNETLSELDKKHYSIVISSAFEPPHNLAYLKHFSTKTTQACGLDTLKYFNLEQTISTPL